jgi:hypothetical protein
MDADAPPTIDLAPAASVTDTDAGTPRRRRRAPLRADDAGRAETARE